MPFNNKFMIGVRANCYLFFAPPLAHIPISDDDMLELAALIIAMKPQLREKFNEILKRVEEG